MVNLYLYALSNFPLRKSRKTKLADGDMSNHLYHSKRSNCSYVYLDSPLVVILNKLIMFYVFIRTGIRFSGSINHSLAPIFMYGNMGDIKMHRDRCMITGKIPKYICVLGLQEPDGGGHFMVNDQFHVDDELGKKVYYNPDCTSYYWIRKGEIFILDNTTHVHGVTTVVGERITTGFRSVCVK